MRHTWTFPAVLAVAVSASAQGLLDQQRQEDARARYRAGEELMRSGAFEQAEGEFKAATELHPGLVPAYCSLGQARMAQQKYAAAVRAYTDCRERIIREGNLDTRSKMETDQRRRDEIRDLEDSVSRFPNSGAMAWGWSVSALRNQRPESPDLPRIPAEVSLGLGSAHFRMGQMTEAEQSYRSAIAVNDKLGEAHNNLAVICMLSGRLEEAEREIKAAEKAGFAVNAKFKDDLKQRLSAKSKS